MYVLFNLLDKFCPLLILNFRGVFSYQHYLNYIKLGNILIYVASYIKPFFSIIWIGSGFVVITWLEERGHPPTTIFVMMGLNMKRKKDVGLSI